MNSPFTPWSHRSRVLDVPLQISFLHRGRFRAGVAVRETVCGSEHERNRWLRHLGGTRLSALASSSARHRGTCEVLPSCSRLSASATL